MDPFACVQQTLRNGHRLIAVIEAALVQELLKTNRIVALVQKSQEAKPSDKAVIVFRAVNLPLNRSEDLSVEQIIPIDASFKCEIDSTNSDVASDVLLNISAGKLRLQFEVAYGQRTNTFVSEVIRATEVVNKRRGAPPEFAWLLPYGSQTLEQSLVSPCVEAVSLIPPTPTDGPLISIGDFVTSDRANAATANEDSQVPAAVVQPGSLSASGSTHSLKESPEINRSFIAKGLSPTPITARESHIRHQMVLREDAYTDLREFSIFVGTYNVNGQPPTVGLGEWLACDGEPPDVYAIGFQELDLSTEAFIWNSTVREQEWLHAVLNGVHPKAHYKKLLLVRLVGMMLIVLVQEKHVAYVRGVTGATVGTGILNTLGNKGAVAIRLDLHSTSICFVNAHMAAQLENIERRNEDYDCIMQKTSFSLNINSPPKVIKDHEHIYFLGDMNYRINTGEFDIRLLAREGPLKLLLENEQLNQQRASKRIFYAFKEGDITFPPTFKYDLNSDDWDSSEKSRLPAWCDRILWYGDGIEQIVYRSHPMVRMSDHKPVSASFKSGIKVIDMRRYRKIYEEVMKKLDKLENEFLPQVSVDTTEIILDPVKFLELQTKSLIIANTGQVPVQFEFIKKLNDTTYCKTWLTVHPYISFIMPGETCQVSLEILVDKQTAPFLNSGKEKMYDILVLHLEGGKDLFITITGDYERSCFGSSINALVHMNVPFKDVPLSRLRDLESNDPQDLCELPYAVPKELWYLVDHLHSHGLQTDGLFTQPGLHKEIGEIRSSLDAGVPNDVLPGSVHSVAQALVLFLEALPEPVVPYALCEAALEATPNFSLCQQVLLKLPSYHKNVFTYLMAFLKELLNHSEDNNLNARTLAMVFGSVLIREPMRDGRITTQAVERKRQTFVHHFLVNDYDC